MKAMLTKEDLNQIGMIVREEVKTQAKASHDDLKGDFRYLHAQIGRLDAKIDGVENRLSDKIDTVMEHVDGLAESQKKFDVELAAHQAALLRLGSSQA